MLGKRISEEEDRGERRYHSQEELNLTSVTKTSFIFYCNYSDLFLSITIVDVVLECFVFCT